MSERNSHHKLLDKLQNEKVYLTNQLEKLKISERSLKNKLQQALSRNSSACNTQNYLSKRTSPLNVCEPNVDTIYQRKKSDSLKRNKRAQIRPSSRSVSPQIKGEDVWKRLSENIRLPSNRAKSRSRSSSMSSTRQSLKYLGIGSTEVSPAPSRRQSRRQSPHSGQSSVQSFKSEIQKNKITSRIPSPTCSRSVSPDLMQKVNKMFSHSRRIRKF
ncbi:hypothetical protein ILUMI_06428 [Ignelater luminosus]|uniref:Uncharacterized protein n=1 Tax=Ignelater luminosus TaxID=2038154 RepID=A0A8K0GH81_IGNLU|nr:hypothetical protein ILUMI_06428 [Ignelater luminosus]